MASRDLIELMNNILINASHSYLGMTRLLNSLN